MPPRLKDAPLLTDKQLSVVLSNQDVSCFVLLVLPQLLDLDALDSLRLYNLSLDLHGFFLMFHHLHLVSTFHDNLLDCHLALSLLLLADECSERALDSFHLVFAHVLDCPPH